jgi:hypothetical protein
VTVTEELRVLVGTGITVTLAVVVTVLPLTVPVSVKWPFACPLAYGVVAVASWALVAEFQVTPTLAVVPLA